MRKKLDLLIDENDMPIGGKWSYDEDNRKKITKNINIPIKPRLKKEESFLNIKNNILKYFSDHPGKMNNLWMPINRKEALIWIDNFFKIKFKNFGVFEDAIIDNNNFLFHSNISPLMNMGLITPDEIIERALIVYQKNNIPLNSFEGFIRQIIGWREFIKGIYDIKGQDQIKSNFWRHNRKLSNDWYDGTTGIEPLDDTIKDCLNYGYTHHIPRLMILSNIMTLSRVNPNEINKWFMEMFVDSSDWVMVPNVYGMGTFSDGGIFSTKPYLCGSNYLLKMSNYKKGEWCEVLDGLYWKFINDNIDFFKTNPRLSIMKNALSKINAERKKIIKGLKEGAWLEYWDDGKISSVTNYKNGQYDGEYLSYYQNGQLNVKANYKNGKKEGMFFDFYQTGQLNWQENYKDGKVDGLSIIYHENGNLWYKTNFDKGTRHGDYLKYNINGKLIEKKIYKNGVKF